jgi:hypothetical protein
MGNRRYLIVSDNNNSFDFISPAKIRKIVDNCVENYVDIIIIINKT